MRRALIPLMLLWAMPIAAAKAPRPWGSIISQHDRMRLKEWRTAWVEALAQARTAGQGARIDAEGVLLRPDTALEHPDAPDGAYRCRVVKLGAQTAGGPTFVDYPGFHCRIGDGMLVKLDGSQRPGGRLFPYDGARILFLGGMALGDEVGVVRYGRDPQRDLVGLLERIGPARWRVVFPRPAWESRIDVMELVPEQP